MTISQQPPETIRVTHRRIACDGSGHGIPAALGHPRIYIEIDARGHADCGYCDRRFVLAGGPADGTAGPVSASDAQYATGNGH